MTLNDAIIRQAEQSNAAVAIQQALSHQPQVDVKDKRMSIIGHGSFGDLRVDLYGVIDHGELDVWDVALSGTTVSLLSAINVKWQTRLQQYAQDAYDRDRSPQGEAAWTA